MCSSVVVVDGEMQNPIDLHEGEAKLEIEPPGLEFAHAVANSTWIQLRRVLGCCGQDR